MKKRGPTHLNSMSRSPRYARDTLSLRFAHIKNFNSYQIFSVLRRRPSSDTSSLSEGCGREIPVEPQPTPKAGTAMRVRPVDGAYSPRGVHSGYEVPLITRVPRPP